MKTSRLRRLSICITDLENIPPEKITIAGNGKKYTSLTTWDYGDDNTNDHDFSVSITRTSQEKQDGIPITYIGGGLIIGY
ncbi:hypothetical protein [Flavobacterium pectinovorum]|uniref:Uncharacterized protein n=1 Tax=Flavobacterium pectinovorum TaxID=29533 RepID=A0A502F2V8_9FLAO|nr:hypothetical protein [Flavobacterium pectinovorum]TPG44353.1 hypothetical protein EAH81_02445 [Flavobacterium pectinovorum]